MIPSPYTPRRSTFGVAMVLLAGLFGLACSDTAVVVQLQLNRKIPDALDAVCLQVASANRERFARRVSVLNLRSTTPTLTVEQGDERVPGFELLLRGEVSRQPVSFNRLDISFSPGEITQERVDVDPCGDRKGGSFEDAGLFSIETPAAVVAMPATQVRGDLVLAISASKAGRFGLPRDETNVAELRGGLPIPNGSPILGALALNVIGEAEGRDCDLDVLVLTEQRPELWIHQDGAFTRSTTILREGAWPVAAVGDLLVGGGVDIALGGVQGLALLLDNNIAGGSYRIKEDLLPASTVVSALVVAQLDDDGNPDLLVGTKSGVDVVLLNDPQGKADFEKASVVGLTDGPSATTALAVADIDRDGKIDVLRATATEVKILRGTGALAFDDTIAFPPSVELSGVTQIIADDLNNDCTADIVLVRPEGIQILYNTYSKGSGTLEPETVTNPKGEPVDPGASRAVVADVNGDGLRDLVLGGDTRNLRLGSYWLEQRP